LKGNEKVD